MRRKSKGIDIVSLKDAISSEAGEITQNLIKNTQGFVKDVSKEISKIKLASMYLSAQKSLRSTVRTQNRAFRRSLRKFRRSTTFKVATREVPKYFMLFKRWSLIQVRKLQNFTSITVRQSRRWTNRNSPAIKSFVKEYYPRVESFVLNQIPAYRLVFAK